MWGQDVIIALISFVLRIIPTRVGTSLETNAEYCTAEDHPHACGDKQDEYNGKMTSKRIIPTRVGTREIVLISGKLEKDHPHACGDKTKEIKENSGFAKSTA